MSLAWVTDTLASAPTTACEGPSPAKLQLHELTQNARIRPLAPQCGRLDSLLRAEPFARQQRGQFYVGGDWWWRRRWRRQDCHAHGCEQHGWARWSGRGRFRLWWSSSCRAGQDTPVFICSVARGGVVRRGNGQRLPPLRKAIPCKNAPTQLGVLHEKRLGRIRRWVGWSPACPLHCPARQPIVKCLSARKHSTHLRAAPPRSWRAPPPAPSPRATRPSRHVGIVIVASSTQPRTLIPPEEVGIFPQSDQKWRF